MKMSALGLVALAATTSLSAHAAAHEYAHASAHANAGVVFGRVLDANDESPIAGSLVSLSAYLPEAGIPQAPQRTVMTTSGGYFVLRDVPAGRYSIAAAAFGFAPNAYPPKIVEISDSDKPVSVSIRLMKLGSISGTVVDERGDPVAGVPVTALRRGTVGGSLALRYELPEVETDDRGVYRIAQLPPGNYVIGVLATSVSLPAGTAEEVGTPLVRGASFLDLLRAGIRREHGDGMRVGDVVLQQVGPTAPLAPDGRLLVYTNTLSPATASAADAAVIALGSGESRTGVDVAIRFAPAVRVSGVATGPAGPMANVAVRLVPVNGTDKLEAWTADLSPAGIAVAVTDANGVFTFPAIAPGQYSLRTEVMNEATADRPAVSLWSAQPLTVAGKTIDGLSVALRPGIRLSGRLEFVDGDAPTKSGSPVGIILRPVGAAGIWRSVPTRITSGDTFTSVGDPPGRYFVGAFQTPGWTLQSVSRGARVLADDLLDLEDEDIRDLVVTFSKQTTRVTGTITDATGAPDLDARIVVFPADTNWWREGIVNSRRAREARSTSAAGFELTGLAPGDYYIAAVSSNVTGKWDDPQFLERLVPGATKFTLDPRATQSLALKTFTPR